MTDRYKNIRTALAMGPTPGPWVQDGDGVSAADEDVAVAMCCPSDAEAAFIAACDPDMIRELLEERDALRKDVERYRYLRGGNHWIVAATQTGFHVDGEELDELLDELIGSETEQLSKDDVAGGGGDCSVSHS